MDATAFKGVRFEIRGDGAYGFPVGPGVGVPGGEHQPVAQKPDVLPNQYPER